MSVTDSPELLDCGHIDQWAAICQYDGCGNRLCSSCADSCEVCTDTLCPSHQVWLDDNTRLFCPDHTSGFVARKAVKYVLNRL